MISFNTGSLYSKTDSSDNGIDRFIDHLDYIKNIISLDRIGIGSDYQARGKYIPGELNENSVFKNLAKAMVKRGYSNEEIAGVLRKNFLGAIDHN